MTPRVIQLGPELPGRPGIRHILLTPVSDKPLPGCTTMTENNLPISPETPIHPAIDAFHAKLGGKEPLPRYELPPLEDVKEPLPEWTYPTIGAFLEEAKKFNRVEGIRVQLTPDGGSLKTEVMGVFPGACGAGIYSFKTPIRETLDSAVVEALMWAGSVSRKCVKATPSDVPMPYYGPVDAELVKVNPPGYLAPGDLQVIAEQMSENFGRKFLFVLRRVEDNMSARFFSTTLSVSLVGEDKRLIGGHAAFVEDESVIAVVTAAATAAFALGNSTAHKID